MCASWTSIDHPGLNPNHPQPVQTDCSPNANSHMLPAYKSALRCSHSAKCPIQPPGTHPTRRMAPPKRPDRRRQPARSSPRTTSHPPHGIAKRPERNRPVPVQVAWHSTVHGIAGASRGRQQFHSMLTNDVSCIEPLRVLRMRATSQCVAKVELARRLDAETGRS